MRDPWFLLLAGLAVLGWLGLLIVWISSSGSQRQAETRISELVGRENQLTQELQARDSASGSLEALTQEIATLEAQRAQLVAGSTTAAADRSVAENQLAEVVAALETRRGELESAQTELGTVSQDLEGRRAELVTVESEISQRSAELADVGGRLEAARSEEAGVRETLAQLNEETSTSAEQVADLERRLQEAREAESDAQLKIAEARQAEAELADSRGKLEAAIAELEVRRTSLSEEVASSDQQRALLQDQIIALTDTLAERGTDLAELERQIGVAQEETTSMAATVEAGFAPGRYVAALSNGRLLSANFEADGTFTLSQGVLPSAPQDLVSGSYEIEGANLTLTDAAGPVGTAQFPMTCVISPTPQGFSISAEGNEGCILRNLSLEKLS
ncbi:MAG: hypothetical protein JWR75_1460 [Devosia sp.]|nr:hypothetical protein [Devosia sp.]